LRSSAEFLLVGLLTWGCALPGFAAFSDDYRGTSSGQFLKLGAGARAMAMGEAQGAAAEGAAALYWNPAALCVQKQSNSVLLQHVEYIESVDYQFGAYSRRFRDYVGGASMMHLSVGDVAHTDAQGNRVGTFRPADWAFSIGGCGQKEQWWDGQREEGPALGAAYKRVRSKLVRSDSTDAFDVGVLSPELGNRRGRLGLSIHNLGGSLRFRNESAPLPTLIRVGSSYRLTRVWLWAMDVQMYRDSAPQLALGTERWFEFRRTNVAFRSGFNTRSTDAAGLSGVSFGLGFMRQMSRDGDTRGSARFDYALVPLGELGLTHQVSLGAEF